MKLYFYNGADQTIKTDMATVIGIFESLSKESLACSKPGFQSRRFTHSDTVDICLSLKKNSVNFIVFQ